MRSYHLDKSPSRKFESQFKGIRGDQKEIAMSDKKTDEILEIDGLKIPRAALEAAEAVILEWERSSHYRADVEAVKIYKIISDGLASVNRKPKEAD
jgi:hypothetical protein